MIRPNRPRRPDPVAMAQPVPPPKAVPQAKPVPPPNAKPADRPFIPRDPDGTHYSSTYHEGECPKEDGNPANCTFTTPHHHSTLTVYWPSGAKIFGVTGPSLFGNYRRLKVLLEEWRAANEKTPSSV